MKHLKHFAVIAVFFLPSCTDKVEHLPTIDVEQAFIKAQEMFLSDFVERIEYSVLESSKPIDKNLKVFSSGSYLICIAYRQIYVFDRQTGAFIREIGRYGNGPGEYTFTGEFYSETQNVTAHKDKHLLEYDLNGKLIRTILKPETENPRSGRLTGNTFLDHNSIVYYNMNAFGEAKERLLISDEYGDVFKTFDHFKSFIAQRGMLSQIGPMFYHHGGHTFFFEICVDTIYHVTKDALIPHFHINMGKYLPPYEKQNMLFGPPPLQDFLINQYFWINNIAETDRFLFFDFRHRKNSAPSDQLPDSFFGYYDKNSKIAKIADVDRNRKRRIVNDIDHFGAIQLSSWFLNEKQNEMVSYIEAVDIAEWFENNPQKAKELPDHLQKLSQLNSTDNPVVVIAKLK